MSMFTNKEKIVEIFMCSSCIQKHEVWKFYGSDTMGGVSCEVCLVHHQRSPFVHRIFLPESDPLILNKRVRNDELIGATEL